MKIENPKNLYFCPVEMGGATVSAGTNRQLSITMSMYIGVKYFMHKTY